MGVFNELNTLFWRQPTFPIIISIIGADGLNFRVRNVIGCDPIAKSPEQKIQLFYFQVLNLLPPW